MSLGLLGVCSIGQQRALKLAVIAEVSLRNESTSRNVLLEPELCRWTWSAMRGADLQVRTREARQRSLDSAVLHEPSSRQSTPDLEAVHLRQAFRLDQSPSSEVASGFLAVCHAETHVSGTLLSKCWAQPRAHLKAWREPLLALRSARLRLLLLVKCESSINDHGLLLRNCSGILRLLVSICASIIATSGTQQGPFLVRSVLLQGGVDGSVLVSRTSSL